MLNKPLPSLIAGNSSRGHHHLNRWQQPKYATINNNDDALLILTSVRPSDDVVVVYFAIYPSLIRRRSPIIPISSHRNNTKSNWIALHLNWSRSSFVHSRKIDRWSFGLYFFCIIFALFRFALTLTLVNLYDRIYVWSVLWLADDSIVKKLFIQTKKFLNFFLFKFFSFVFKPHSLSHLWLEENIQFLFYSANIH